MGIVQGLTEYLPVSSSGHLEIFNRILGLDLSGAEALDFDLALHLATVLSTIVVLWREFVPLCRSVFTLQRDANTVYVGKILLSCVPVAIVGLCFKDTVESFFGGNLRVVGTCLLVTAVLLTLAYFFATRPELMGRRRTHSIRWIDALVMGCAQAVAVLPGLSRSGSTIAAGLLCGDDRAATARFSFFMVIIPILGEALLSARHMLVADGTPVATGMLPLAIGFIAAFVVGCAACSWMISLVKKGRLVWFALYCLAAGLLCLLW